MIRADSQCGRVLRVLADGKPHTVNEIHRRAGTMRLNSVAARLRRAGYGIECERLAGRTGASAYRYQLTGVAADVTLPTEFVDELVETNYPEIDGDAYAPRTPEERYRLYRLTGGDELELVATATDPESVGVALATLGAEKEWERCAFGLLDTHGTDAKPGTWLISPYDAKATL